MPPLVLNNAGKHSNTGKHWIKEIKGIDLFQAEELLYFRNCHLILLLILTHFQPMFHFYTPLKSENLWFYDVFRVYRSRALLENGLREFKWII